MDNSEYTKIYSTLGVFQDDGWEMIRAAYKKQIKRWHPDRFQDPNHQMIAEEKSKEINLAYQKLCEYYEKFGVLPPDHGSDTVSRPSAPAPSETERTDSHEDSHLHLHGVAPVQHPTQRSYIPIVIMGVVIAIGYSIWDPTFLSNQAGTHEVDLTGHPTTTPDNSLAAKNPDGSESTPESESGATPTANWAEAANTTLHKTNASSAPGSYKTHFEFEAAPASALSQQTLIKKGSTKNEVLAVQGPPQRQTDTAWDYGASRIYFQGGQVSGWYENPLNPLSIVR